MNVGVIGVGGVGGYFGGKLATYMEQDASDELKVYFVARNKHLEEIRRSGLILNTADEGEQICRPTLATDNFDDLPMLDLCLLCVKSYDLNSALKSVKGIIKSDTEIIPLLNGVDIYERIRRIIPKGIVYPSCVYVGTRIERPGKVAQDGGSCRIFLGKDPRYPADLLPQRILGLFDASKVKYTWCDDIYQEIWSKYIFIAAYGMVTASENKTLGQIMETEDLSKMVISIMSEIAEIAKKQGIRLLADIVEESVKKAKSFPYDTKTSFQRDFEQKDKPDERDLFGDTIIRLGEFFGVETPTFRLVNDKLWKLKRLG